jgi:glycosyltransferase involved in cell wall biosynthesis
MQGEKNTIMILGKVPPPYMGPSIATELLLKSGLNNHFNLVHVDTKVNSDLRDIGKWSLNKLRKNIQIYSSMISKIKMNNPKLILIPFSQSTIGFIKDSAYIWIGILKGRKVLLHLRGSDFRRWINSTSLLTKWFVKKTLSKTAGVIVLGNNLKYLFDGFYPDSKIFVCPNGGTYTIPARTKTEKLPLRILYLGNLQPSKGIEDVIEAASLLNKSGLIDFEFEIIGGWRKDDVKERCLNKVKIENLSVKFFPPEASKEKFNLMANADIFLFPPREPEGHPWVIVEAMASSLPIISTDQGAIIESVIDGYNGYVVPSNSPMEIAEKLKLLLSNDELRDNMSKASHSHYKKEFTEERMVEKLTTIFNSVINN